MRAHFPAWRPALPGDWPRLLQLLLVNEPAWVSLIDRLDAASPWWHHRVWVLDAPRRPGPLRACFHLNSSGLGLFAALSDDPAAWQLAELVLAVRKPLSKLFCLIGLSDQISALQGQLRAQPMASNRYQVMVKPGANVAVPKVAADRCIRPATWQEPSTGFVWRGLDFRRASEADTEALLELQCQYEVEEVLVSGHAQNRAMTRHLLAASLREQCIYCVSHGSEMLAKAGTNGSSWNFVQIGGVFTLPGWRNHGLGEHLMAALLAEILGRGHGASLFVKHCNPAALHLYGKLGFESVAELTIAYY